MDLDLAGRRYVVTGGSRGIGRAIVTTLLAEGARVATCSRGEPGWGAEVLVRPGDVRDRGWMREFVAEAAETFGGLDGVVANAGAGAGGGVLDTPLDVWRDQCDVKLVSVLNLVEPAVEHMTEGAVVVMNGVTARAPEPDMAAVSAARAAAGSLAAMLAKTLAPRIRVNTVNLGAIATERQHAKHARSGVATFAEWEAEEARRRGIPLGRFGTPEEVAPMVAMLLSPLSSYVAGAVVDVAGGLGT